MSRTLLSIGQAVLMTLIPCKPGRRGMNPTCRNENDRKSGFLIRKSRRSTRQASGNDDRAEAGILVPAS